MYICAFCLLCYIHMSLFYLLSIKTFAQIHYEDQIERQKSPSESENETFIQ